MSAEAEIRPLAASLKAPGANRSLPARIARGLRAQPTGLVGLLLILIYLGVALLGKHIAPYPYDEMGVGPLLAGPSSDHLFGTDEFGRDVFSRVILGAPISLRVGLFVVVLATLLGSAIGLISGFAGGWLDEILMRICDLVLSFPGIILALAIAAGYWFYRLRTVELGMLTLGLLSVTAVLMAGLIKLLVQTHAEVLGLFLGAGLLIVASAWSRKWLASVATGRPGARNGRRCSAGEP